MNSSCCKEITTVAVLRRAIGLSSRLNVRTLMANLLLTEGNNRGAQVAEVAG